MNLVLVLTNSIIREILDFDQYLHWLGTILSERWPLSSYKRFYNLSIKVEEANEKRLMWGIKIL